MAGNDSVMTHPSPGTLHIIQDDIQTQPDTAVSDTIGPLRRPHVTEPRRAGYYYPEDERRRAAEIASDTDRSWWHLLRQNRLSLSDTTVQWPRFLKFCVGVYFWGDRFFNGVDPEYISGTGRRWKVRLVNDNWTDAYNMRLSRKMDMNMVSDPYSNLGVFLQYMAVSYGYTLDLSNVIGNRPISHNKMGFGFSCARFNAEASYSQNSGGTYLRTFGDYNNGHLFKEYFPGLEMENLSVDAYYFFNHRRYSYGAAYSFAKIQRRSAGSWMAGFSYSYQNISVDFTQLPQDLIPYLTIQMGHYRFRYNDYALLVGYGYNFVLPRGFLLNLTGLPAIGVNHSYEDSVEGSANLLSLGVRARMSLTYNHRDFFAGFSAKWDAHWYNSSSYSFLSSLIPFSFTAGVRF